MYKFTFKPFSAMAYPFIFYAANNGLFPFYFWGFGVIEVMKYSRKYLEPKVAHELTQGIVDWADRNHKRPTGIRRSAGADVAPAPGGAFSLNEADALYEAILNDSSWAEVTVDVTTLVRQYALATKVPVNKEEVVSWLEGIHTHSILKKMARSIETVTAVSPNVAQMLELNQKVDAATAKTYRQAAVKDSLEATTPKTGKWHEISRKLDQYIRKAMGAGVSLPISKVKPTDGVEPGIHERARWANHTAEVYGEHEALRVKVDELELPMIKPAQLYTPQESSVLTELAKLIPKSIRVLIPVRVPKKPRVHVVAPVHTPEGKGTEPTAKELKQNKTRILSKLSKNARTVNSGYMEVPGFREVFNSAKGAVSGASYVTETFVRGNVSRGEIDHSHETYSVPPITGIDKIVADVFKSLQRQGADSVEVDVVESGASIQVSSPTTDTKRRKPESAHVGAVGAAKYSQEEADDVAVEISPEGPESAHVAVPVRTPPPQSAHVAVPVRVPRKVRLSKAVPMDARTERRKGVKLMPWRKPKTGVAFDKIWLNPEHTEITATLELRRKAIADLVAETDRILARDEWMVRWTFEPHIRDWLNARIVEYPLLLELESLWQVCLEGGSESILKMVSEGCDSFTDRYITPLEDEKKALAAEAHISFKAMLDFTLMIEQFIWSSRFFYAASLGADAIDDLVRVVTDWGNEMPEEQQYLARWFRWWAAGERTKRLNDETLSGLEAVTIIKDKMVEYFDSRWGKRIVEYGVDGMYVYSTDHSYIDRIRGKKHGVAGNLVDKKTMKEEYGFTEDDLVYDVENDKRR